MPYTMETELPRRMAERGEGETGASSIALEHTHTCAKGSSVTDWSVA